MTIKKWIRFLGGLPLALFLIASATLFVIAGTFIESVTDSHHAAALLTYDSPLFTLLLWGFFVNILVSALRRFPFQKKHLPFLMTHLGMLLILGGMLIKSRYGLQGTMTLLEGSGSNEVFFPGSYAIRVDAKNNDPEYFLLNNNLKRYSKAKSTHYSTSSAYTGIDISILDSTQHSEERLESWIKGSRTSILGAKSTPVYHSKGNNTSLPNRQINSLLESPNTPYHLLAIVSQDPAKIAKKIYVQATTATIKDTLTDKILVQIPLSQLLKKGISTPHGEVSCSLDFSWNPSSGFDTPALHMTIASKAKEEKVTIFLTGNEALFNHNETAMLGKAKITVDLETSPTLLFLQNEKNDVCIFGYGKFGQVAASSYLSDNLKDVMAYDDGYLGYTVETQLPGLVEALNRDQREKSCHEELKNRLRTAALDPTQELTPPLKLLQEVCQNSHYDFADIAVAFLDSWNKNGGWLYSAEQEPHQTIAAELSRQFRAFDLHANTMLLPSSEPEAYGKPLILETPLIVKHQSAAPKRKLEDNIPSIALQFTRGKQKEVISLRYDSFANGLKWPIFQGEYLVRFQPLFKKIPFRLRLRQARQINYPNTNQPYSYESDLLIKELEDSSGFEHNISISMNHVHETLDGFRFYLANIAPKETGALKRVQIVVNHDPTKYLLTYPGALFMTLGILGLFFFRFK